jgi:spermidine/putrescine transport system substrate-binding protein
MFAKVMTGNSGWDIVFPSNSYVVPMKQMDLLARLDHRLLPNLVHLDDRFRSPFWDKNLEWSVPYMHGATGIVYSTKAPAASQWADLWSNRYRGRVTMLDDSAEVFGACLKRLNHSVNATDPGQLERGDVLAAQSWSVTAQQAIELSNHLAFAYPNEGFPLYCDTAAILRESSRQELAHQFLNYLLRPEVASAIAMEMRTATANGAARRMLPEKDRNNPTLYPPAEILARGEWFRALPPAAERLRDKLWTEVKSG